MYNNAARCWELTDASGSYDWIVENMGREDCQEMTDAAIYEWVGRLIDAERDLSINKIEERATNKRYPCFGYTTADFIRDEDEYIAFWTADFESDMLKEREYVFNWIKDWIKGGN